MTLNEFTSVAGVTGIPSLPVQLAAPREAAAWYDGTGTTLYVLGMPVSAFALRPIVGGP